MKIIPFISSNSEYSRRKAEELVKTGKVRVNNKKPNVNQEVSGSDVIQINGHKLEISAEKITFLIYKPKGYISTTSDELGRKTVLDLISKQKVRLYPVGRLDAESTGLMILTNDGDLTNKYTHPSNEVKKTYKVKLDRYMPAADIKKLEKGVKLKEGIAKPDSVKVVGKNVLEITLHEGRNREIRRMLGKLGFKVIELERIQIGEYSLKDLRGKKWIKLTSRF